MGSINKVFILGRIGNEVEKKVTQGGASIVNLSVATSEKYKDKQGEKQEKTTWHKVVLWNNLADLVENFFKKGQQIHVEGKLETKEWTDDQGNKRVTTQIIVKEVTFVDGKEDGGGNQSYSKQVNKPVNSDTNKAIKNNNSDLIEDDIPF